MSEVDDFDSNELPEDFQSLRVPVTPDWANLEDRPGFLRLYGRESLSSFHHQSLLARRLQHFDATAATALEFQPDTYEKDEMVAALPGSLHPSYRYCMSVPSSKSA